MSSEQAINIHVEAHYLPGQSSPETCRYAFAYTITISNSGANTVQLLARKWEITDANGIIRVVEGEGVVGEKPVLAPEESYTYTSGAVLSTRTGSMEGHYIFRDDNQQKFNVAIPTFALIHPGSLQ